MDDWVLIPLVVGLSASLAGWFIYRAIRKMPIKVHMVFYGLSVITAIFSIVFFLTMDIPTIAKVLGALVLGGVLIFLAQRRQQRGERGDASVKGR